MLLQNMAHCTLFENIFKLLLNGCWSQDGAATGELKIWFKNCRAPKHGTTVFLYTLSATRSEKKSRTMFGMKHVKLNFLRTYS